MLQNIYISYHLTRTEEVEMKHLRNFGGIPTSGWIILLMVVTSRLSLDAQGFEERIYNSYITGDMSAWKNTMQEMESNWQATGSNELLYDLVVAEYGYFGYLFKEDDKKSARQLLKKSEEHLNILLDAQPGNAAGYAFLGAVYGNMVRLDAYKAPVLGLRSFEANERAFELDPDDPQVWVEKGNIEFFKPNFLGSDSREAAKLYLRAVELYERDPENLENNWLYLNSLRSLIEAYIDSDQLFKAEATFQKLLRAEPGLTWVRDNDYPRFLRKYEDLLE